MKSIDIFPWNENFNTGLSIIDEQHQKLAQILNLLASHMADKTEIPALNLIFDELTDYSVYHFRTEESIWHEYLPDDVMEAEHKVIHSSFISKISKLKRDENSSSVDKVVEEILTFLTRWLASHILETDRHMAMLVLAIQSGMSLASAKIQAKEQMGGTMKVLIEIILSTYGNHVTNTLHLMKEIAERRQAQETQLQKEQYQRALLDTFPYAVWLKDTESNFLSVNEGFARIFGAKNPEELVGKNDFDIAPHDLAESYRAHDRMVRETRQKTSVEELIQTEGTLKWFETHKAPVIDVNGKLLGTVGFARDITDRKLAEETLRERETFLRLSQEVGGIGSWEADLVNNRQTWSENCIALLGFPPQSNSTWEDFLAFVHPDDRQRVIDATQSHLVHGSIYDVEFRAISQTGDIRWMRSTGQAERDAEGKPILMRGITQDVTEHHLADESLRINASVFESSQEAIVITDSNNTIVEVNPAFTHITGYSREEVLGRSPKMLSSGRQDNTFYAGMWRSLEQERSWRGEIWNRRKSGEIYAELLSISAICDSDGKVLRYVGVFSDISLMKEHEAELSRVAHYDALTGIPNRVLLADRMKQAIAQTAREQNMMAVCYLDLDGFKPINDTLGHETGDHVLIEVAKRIEHTIRGGDTVARLGGDEFVVLLLGQDKGEECVATLGRLLAAIAQPIMVNNITSSISASIGVSIYPLDDEDPDTLMRHADHAMYMAKQAGKNRFHIYDPALDQRARNQHNFLKSIRHALEHNQFELLYQPKVNLRTQELVGAEALIRWRHPERGLLSPAEFLRHVENTDLDIEIGEWVTTTALAQIDYWRNHGLDIEVSINISGYHLESPRFVERLQQQLAHYPDMPSGKLQIEVLETVALNDIAVVRGIIESCRTFGVGFALDDFGTGYSSLSYLSGLPVDVLKIDQSFVRDMLDDKGDMAIVQGIIALARAFDRNTVAEGIETRDHYMVLRDMGCEIGQGYGIARPMPADGLTNWQANFRH